MKISSRFAPSFRNVMKLVNLNATKKGFWPSFKDVFGFRPTATATETFEELRISQHIALVHSELSEMLEAIRHGNKPSDHIPEFSGAEEEAADVVIRMMNICAYKRWRLSEAIVAKIAFNETRPYQHGGKRF